MVYKFTKKTIALSLYLYIYINIFFKKELIRLSVIVNSFCTVDIFVMRLDDRKSAKSLSENVNSSEQSDLRQLQFAQFLGYHFTRRNVNQSRDLETDLISRLEVFSLSKIFNSKSLQFFSRLKELSTDNSFFCV